MNNEKLLVIAKGMGKRSAKLSRFGLGNGSSQGYIFISGGAFNPYKNDTQFKEVLEWLLTKGCFTSIDATKRKYQGTVDFRLHVCIGGRRFFNSSNGKFDKELLEIAYLVANELINEGV